MADYEGDVHLLEAVRTGASCGHGMKDCTPLSTTLDWIVKFSALDGYELVDASLYRKLDRSLIWLLNTRLDICSPVGLL